MATSVPTMTLVETPASNRASRSTRARAVLAAVALVLVGFAAGVLVARSTDGDRDVAAGSGTEAPASDDLVRSVDAPSLVADGLAAYNAGDLGAAEASYRAALDASPEDVTALYNLAQLMQVRGDVADSTELYRRALAIAPEFHSARYNLAIALHSLGDVESAIGEMRTIVDADPDSVGALYALGNLVIGQGDVEEGAALVERAIAVDPTLLDTSAAVAGS